jgi:hypothetical protein
MKNSLSSLLKPSQAFSSLLKPSQAFSSLLKPSQAFSSLYRGCCFMLVCSSGFCELPPVAPSVYTDSARDIWVEWQTILGRWDELESSPDLTNWKGASPSFEGSGQKYRVRIGTANANQTQPNTVVTPCYTYSVVNYGSTEVAYSLDPRESLTLGSAGVVTTKNWKAIPNLHFASVKVPVATPYTVVLLFRLSLPMEMLPILPAPSAPQLAALKRLEDAYPVFSAQSTAGMTSAQDAKAYSDSRVSKRYFRLRSNFRDYDGNGVLDYYQLLEQYDPASFRTLDLDGDGSPDWQENAAGSDPNDKGSTPQSTWIFGTVTENRPSIWLSSTIPARSRTRCYTSHTFYG